MSICLALTDADWSLTKDVFSIIGTLVSAAAVGVAYYFGREGLSTWRRQLRGSADHELSRRALIELYHFRDAIRRARAPAIFPDERQPFEGESQAGSLDSDDFQGEVRAYRRRIQALADASNPFKASITEAEALWGKELFELMQGVYKLEREFLDYVQFYLGAKFHAKGTRYEKDMEASLARRRDVLCEIEEPHDEYWNDMLNAFHKVERYLKSKLIP